MAEEKGFKARIAARVSKSRRQSETQSATMSGSEETPKPTQSRRDKGSDGKLQVKIFITLLVLPIFAFVVINAAVATADYLINGFRQVNLNIQLVESMLLRPENDPNNVLVLFSDADLNELRMRAVYQKSFSPDAKTAQSQKNDTIIFPSDFEVLFSRNLTAEKYTNLNPKNVNPLWPAANGSFVRLGDTVYRESIPKITLTGTRTNNPNFFAVIGSKFSGEGEQPVLFILDDAGKKRVLESAIRLSLLKADDLGFRKITFYAIESAEFPTELWRDNIQNLAREVQGYLAKIRDIEFIIKTRPTELKSVSESFGGISALLKRRLFLRTPVANQEKIFPLRVGATPLANESANSGDATTSLSASFQKRVFLPTTSVAGSLIILPLLLAYTALLIAAAASIARAVHHKWQFKDQWNDPLKLAIAGIIPLIYAAFTWWSWSQPINWQPDTIPFQPSSLFIHAAMIIAGAISGGVVFRQAFEEIPDIAPDTEDDPECIKTSLINDNPVSNWKERDRLGFGKVVLALASLFDNRSTLPPLVASINGPWGSGKSSIMRMLETQLAETERFHFAWFNAWQYRNENEILQAFLRTLSNQLKKDLGPTFKLRMAWIRWKNASDLTRLGYIAPILALAALAFVAIIETDADKAKVTYSFDPSSNGLIATIYGILGLFGIGGTINSIRWLKPFQRPLMDLLSNTGATASESHIEHFNREFQFFREAVGGKKFLIFIDDLDRCPPESVVEVLKAVNLIATSSDGVGKTFFLLGFDWHYVLNTIELHFEKLMNKASMQSDGNFGREYLKKIVTLPISVPKPSRAQIKNMVTTLDDPDTAFFTEDKEEKQWSHKLRQTLTDMALKILMPFYRPLNVVALFTILFAVNFYPALQDPVPGPEKNIDAKSPVTNQPAATVPADINPALGIKTITLSPPSPPAGSTFGSNAMTYTALGLVLLLFVVFGLRQFAILRRQKQLPPEPRDPAEFIKAVEALAPEMPENPRDIIRVVNTMRVAYLVQTSGQFNEAAAIEGPSADNDIFAGLPFTPAQSTRLSLWYYRFAHVLDIKMIEEKLLPKLKAGNKKLSSFIAAKKPAGDDQEFANWLAGFSDSLEKIPGLKNDIAEPEQFQRFVDIYRHLLQINSTTPKSESNPDQVKAL